MAITLNSITTPTSDAASQGTGELAPLSKNPYSVATFQYPLEGLGQNTAPHYVLFNINLPASSKYFGNNASQTNTDQNSASAQNFNLLNNNSGKTGQAITGAGVASSAGFNATLGGIGGFVEGGGSGSGGILGTLASKAGGAVTGAAESGLLTAGAGLVAESISVKPKLKRIKTTIALYMPETVITSYDHDWNATSLTAALGDLGKGASIGFKGIVDAFTDTIQGVTGKQVHFNNASETEIAGTLAEATGKVGEGFTDLALNSIGRAINPQIEMVFKGTANRGYVFEFDFQPRSQQEALSIYNIIKTFKTYAAPELANEGNGRYFIPPGEFDISFHFMNVENQSIAKISTCVLTNIAVNYNGSGPWATFVDGVPLHIHVALTFKEMDIITRQLIEEFGY